MQGKSVSGGRAEITGGSSVASGDCLSQFISKFPRRGFHYRINRFCQLVARRKRRVLPGRQQPKAQIGQAVAGNIRDRLN